MNNRFLRNSGPLKIRILQCYVVLWIHNIDAICIIICLISFFSINDRVISANNVSLEGVDYGTAVQVLRDSGQSVNLVVKRRVILPPAIPASQLLHLSDTQPHQAKLMNVSLQRSKKKDDFGVVLGCRIYIKEIVPKTVAYKDGILKEGDEVTRLNGTFLDNLTLKEAKKLLDSCKDKLDLTVKRTDPSVSKLPLKNGLVPNGLVHNNFVKGGNHSTPPRPPLPNGNGKILIFKINHFEFAAFFQLIG